MIYPEYRWCDIALEGVHKRNNVVDVSTLKIPEGKPDCYRTVFRYPDTFKDHFRINKNSVSGYAGPVYADLFPIDIDDDESLEVALQTAVRVLDRLAINYEVELEALRLYFSGAKGFHIMIPARMFGFTPSGKLPATFKAMAAELLEGVKYDPSIYDAVRLFRMANTINSRTGLYKIPLYPAEILHSTISDITGMAKAPRKIELVNEYDQNAALAEVYLRHLNKRAEPKKAPTGELLAPNNAKLCYYSIMAGVGSGNRDNCALRLATYWRKQGLPGDMIHAIMQTWNRRNTPPLDDDEVIKAVRQAEDKPYDFGCNDPILKEFCDVRCHLKDRDQGGRVSKDRIYDIKAAHRKYLEYIKDLEKRKITLGIPLLDKAMRGISPGEVCQVLARSGVGKTAFLLNIIKHLSSKGIKILFFSLEQPIAQIFERSGQISCLKEGWEVEKAFKDGSDMADHISRNIGLNYANMLTVDEDNLTYEEMRQFVDLSSSCWNGEKPGLVCIDYLGRMKGGRGSRYEVVGELAKQLKRLAKDMDVAVIYLNQTNRTGKTGEEAITMDMGRDSGELEEAADFVIGLWRPDINKAEMLKKPTEDMKIAALKNRKGTPCQTTLTFNKKYLAIYQPDDAIFSEQIEYDVPF